MNQFISSIKSFALKYESQKDVIENLYLPAIVESYHRVSLMRGISKLIENKIRDEFVKDFISKNTLLKDYIANNTLKFTNENRIISEDKNEFRTDIEFFISFYGNFVIECKRLSSAESRYINGREIDGEYKVDGLERFITLSYSANDKYACMMAFVIKGDSQTIMEKLKDLVKNYHPSSSPNDLLDQQCANWKYSFQSLHSRVNKTDIHIYHCFFPFYK